MGSLRESEVDGFVDERTGRMLEIFSAWPSSAGAPTSYLKRARDVARWSERNGCTGEVIYAANRLVDPWLVSQVIVQSTKSVDPAIRPQFVVSAALQRYVQRGFGTFILDEPHSDADPKNVRVVIDCARIRALEAA